MGNRLSQPNTEKNTESAQSSELKFTCVSMQGWERKMASSSLCKINIDTNKNNGNSIFAIFDGFRGFQVSFFLKETFLSVLVNSQLYLQGNYEEALKFSFEKVDELIRSEKGQKRLKQIRAQNKCEEIIQNEIISQNSGSLASVLLITKRKIYTAHIGESRMYLMKQNKSISLFESHKPEAFEEKLRIQVAGGNVVQGRVNGNVKISRAFGMNSFKKNPNLSWEQQMITCLPSIKTVERNISDQFILMGCEGLWQNYEKRQPQLLKKTKQLIIEKKQDLNQCLTFILDSTIAPGSSSQSDLGYKSMTGILVKFNQV